ncbi:MAG: hypothetical protein JOZ62_19150 [Acidobacteriaceae bacterium]|nr:hypothetical protein [Acidobacteriaceae bacterium]
MCRSTLTAILIAAIAVLAHAQVFSSGSTGSDGPLNITTQGTVLFDPQSFTPPLNSKGDNVYDFTTVTIARGVTVKLSSKNLRGPIFWLVQGPVQIDGAIDLNGDDSPKYANGDVPRTATLAGAGGHGGGIGAQNNNIAKQGYGPGGGEPGQGGKFTGNKLLVPLVGGSGGGGSSVASGGGAGGALLIASSTSITINGTISANGGNQGDPGFAVTGGSGGAIRLIAPLITGSGAVLTANGGAANGGISSGQDGKIRLEAFDNELRGTTNGTPLSIGKPFKLFLPPDPPPSVRVVSVGGITVQANTGSSLELPKTNITASDPVAIILEARYVRPGTVLKLHFISESGKDQTVASTALVGTFQLSHATAPAAIEGGLTHLAIEASWQPEPQSSVERNSGAQHLAKAQVARTTSTIRLK